MLVKCARTCLFFLGCLLVVACSAPTETTRSTPPDPAADSVADGLMMTSDTTIVDDDTLETGKKQD